MKSIIATYKTTQRFLYNQIFKPVFIQSKDFYIIVKSLIDIKKIIMENLVKELNSYNLPKQCSMPTYLKLHSQLKEIGNRSIFTCKELKNDNQDVDKLNFFNNEKLFKNFNLKNFLKTIYNTLFRRSLAKCIIKFISDKLLDGYKRNRIIRQVLLSPSRA